MDVAAVLTELYGRLPPLVRHAVDGLSAEDLVRPPVPGANTVGWLVWHLTRVQDHHVAELLGEDQVWVTGPWADRFGLAPDPRNTGYGHTAEQVASVRPAGPDALIGYYDAVHARTAAFLAQCTPAALDEIVDVRWDPPVRLGERLVSIADDDLEHVGQAAYARGLLSFQG
jgi:uncharacterized damage-inducible protein DinB